MNFCDFNGSGLASPCFSFSISTAAKRVEADSRIPGLFRSPWEPAESDGLVYILHLLKLG